MSVWQPLKLTVFQRNLSSLDNLTRLNAASADLHASVTSCRKLDTNGLKIWIKPSPGLVVSV